MKSDKPFVSFLRRNGAALLLAIGLFAAFYCAAYRLTRVRSDYFLHTLWAMDMTPRSMLASFYNGSERLWHIFVHLTANSVIPDMFKASAAVTALADAVTYYMVFMTFDRALPEKMPRWLLAVIVFVPFFATSLTVPGGGLYAGVGGLNTWHNPTNIMVRPFAAAVFYMTVCIYNRRRYGRHAVFAAAEPLPFRGGFRAQFGEPIYTRGELILYPLCLLLSVYAKPSFLQFFAPAIFVFLLVDVIRTRGMLLPFCIKLALAYIPAAVIMLMVFRGFFPSGASSAAESAAEASASASGGAGIAIYFIAPAFDGAGDFLLSLLGELKYLVLPCAFPLAVFLIGGRRGGARSTAGLAAACVVIAFLETLLLHETGDRADHGNFLWGMYLASWLAWTAGAGEYALLVQEKDRRGRLALYIGTPLLIWHLICGIAYFVLILRDGNYYI